MIIHIIKRDGRKVPFNIEKIANAIFRAAQTQGGTDFNTAMEVAVEVCSLYEKEHPGETPTVEEIQDLVEKTLIEKGHAKTAKAYILYRYERTRSREMKTNLMCVLNELTFSSAKDSDIKRENANIDGDTAMGTMLKYGKRPPRSIMRCMFSTRSTQRLTARAISTFMTLISIPSPRPALR